MNKKLQFFFEIRSSIPNVASKQRFPNLPKFRKR